jgi:hypothetical protein
MGYGYDDDDGDDKARLREVVDKAVQLGWLVPIGCDAEGRMLYRRTSSSKREHEQLEREKGH